MKNNKKIKYLILGIVLFLTTIVSLAIKSEAIFAPILTMDFVFLLMWKFKPDRQLYSEKAAYLAIITFGLFSALASAMLSILIPIYADQWNIEKHLDDIVLYPIVNDGRENCYIANLLFIFYIGFSFYCCRKNKKT
ncbi:hypothetical protein KKC67_00640 [Patescibacteria group bacterium]|nr:hypothetical protein [Patescibacteria group bacterium]MBU0879615.1 hypothetical protein [Patescibacteria group bacterium]MBU0879955.1 hypothetical protein [Patescibacteria group bacterium]MBU0897709.1 hypothetical protein [Patescibacteria group bacterium]MBU1991505.1 hypothetical protein [Patescibacteria group bacterium]